MRAAGKNIMLLTSAISVMMLTYSCKKAFAPNIAVVATDYLVVEAVINPGGDSTKIRLSRTVKLNNKTGSNPELNAQVDVESDNGTTYPINELGNGKYGSQGLNLDNSRKYRLRIKTADGQGYLSDLVAVKITPPIDSIGYNILKDTLMIYANAHDDSEKTHYYRWDYEETWLFHAKYLSLFVSNGLTLERRSIANDVYYCFDSHVSDNVVLASSANLSHDFIYQAPIILIRGTSEKMESQYSILVRQYALTKDAFEYWQNLKKNTEQIGSIFDAQPSSNKGNIHCTTDPSVPVLGYVSISTVPEKRIFVSNRVLPSSWQPIYPYDCGIDSLKKFEQWEGRLVRLPSNEIAVDAIGDFRSPSGYTATSIPCGDCTIRGTKKRPDFWK